MERDHGIHQGLEYVHKSGHEVLCQEECRWRIHLVLHFSHINIRKLWHLQHLGVSYGQKHIGGLEKDKAVVVLGYFQIMSEVLSGHAPLCEWVPDLLHIFEVPDPLGSDAIENGTHQEALEEGNSVQCDQTLGVAKDVGQEPGRKEIELLHEVGAPFVCV